MEPSPDLYLTVDKTFSFAPQSRPQATLNPGFRRTDIVTKRPIIAISSAIITWPLVLYSDP